MIKKKYKVEIDCPNCALKAERNISKLSFVHNASVNFMTGKMIVDCDEIENIDKEILKAGKKADRDFTMQEIK